MAYKYREATRIKVESVFKKEQFQTTTFEVAVVRNSVVEMLYVVVAGEAADPR